MRYVALKLSVLHDMNYNALSQLLASVSAQQKEQAWNKLKKPVTLSQISAYFFDIYDLFEGKKFTKKVSKLDQTLE